MWEYLFYSKFTLYELYKKNIKFIFFSVSKFSNKLFQTDGDTLRLTSIIHFVSYIYDLNIVEY
jgi:hypothetical protein